MKSSTKGRFGVIITFVSLIMIVALSEIVGVYGISPWIIAVLAISTALLLIMYFIFYHKSGLWEFVHRKFDKYDEREAQIALNSSRISYEILSVICLSILLLYSVFEIPVNIVLVGCLIYFAHILPASVIAWRGLTIS